METDAPSRPGPASDGATGTLAYTVCDDDIVALQMALLRISPAIRRAWRVQRIALGVLGAAAGLLLYLLGEPVLAVGVVLLGLVFVTLLPSMMRGASARLSRQVVQESRGAFTTGPQVLSFDDDGLEVRSHVGELRLRWSAVGTVERTPDHLFAFYGRGAAIIVPRARVTAGAFDAFADDVARAQRIGAARAAAPPVGPRAVA